MKPQLHHRRRLRFEPLETRHLLAAAPIISEFMASNGGALIDGNSESSDWIEIYNGGDEAVDLAGYSLTDDIDLPTKWRFPSTLLEPGKFEVVFASGNNAPDPEGNLHTNFKLSASGEYVALLDTAGNTLSSFSSDGSNYPPQSSDQSYGLGFNSGTSNVLTPDSLGTYHVPSDDSVDGIWRDEAFDDSSWTSGTASLGYDTGTAFQNLIQTPLPVGTVTTYVRIPFTVDNPSASPTRLSLKYDDGFVAYINGTRVAASLAPNTVNYQSAATATRGGSAALNYIHFNLTDFDDVLHVGTNVLAIQMLNLRPAGRDFLMVPNLEILDDIMPNGSSGFLTAPTPGEPNSTVLSGDVTFSKSGGIFTTSFPLTLTSSDPADEIRYTTDGTNPTSNSPLYTNPINITFTTQVRAQAFGGNGKIGRLNKQSFTFADAPTAAFTSDLPIVVIENFGGGIPTKTRFRDGFISLIDVDPATGRSSLSGTPEFTMNMAFHRRGSSTSGNPKPNYRVELRDNNGDDQAVSLLGMPSESDWILYAPYTFDRAMLRNPFFMSISAQMGNYAIRTRYVEVYGNTNGGNLNANDYQGVYVLMENIKRDSERVDIAKLTPTDNTEPNVTGGYIFKIDRTDGQSGSEWTSSMGNRYVHYDPERADMTPQQVNYLRGSVNELETVLFGRDWKDAELGYENYFDVDASIDHHLVKTLSKDPDALRLSTYLVKDRNGKIGFGPVWDFDRSAGPDTDGRAANPVGWDTNSASFFRFEWWSRLFSDPNFEQRWVERWKELRKDVLSNENISNTIDGLAAQIEEAQVRNFNKWTSVRPNGGPYAEPRRLSGWEGEVSHLKNWLITRADWMDTQMIGAPTFFPGPGRVAAGTAVTLVASDNGDSVYYTLDGTDPRGNDGVVSPTATLYSGPIAIDSSSDVNVRAFRGNTRAVSKWSELILGSFSTAIPADANSLRISELHFHPEGPSNAELAAVPNASDSDFEFIEFTNISSVPISLFDAEFTSGITFDFANSSVTTLDPGEEILLVSNADAFAARYGSAATIRVAGEYTGNLSNGGELLVLLDLANGNAIHVFTYDDVSPWPFAADGNGPSMAIIDPLGDYDDPNNWRSSAISGGTPGEIPGDFNRDGRLDCVDLIPLSVLASAQANLPQYDVNGNGTVDRFDVAYWVKTLAGTELGDANVDGTIDRADFLIWNEHRFTQNASYCSGDFNTDGIVDVSDFNLFNAARTAQLAAGIASAEDDLLRFDITRDGLVNPNDALRVINHLNNRNSKEFDSALDMNADGQISPLDALLVINRLNEQSRVADTAIFNPKIVDATFEEDDEEQSKLDEEWFPDIEFWTVDLSL